MYSEIVNWKTASVILEKHDKPDVESSRQLISNRVTDEYVKEAISKKLRWEAE